MTVAPRPRRPPRLALLAPALTVLALAALTALALAALTVLALTTTAHAAPPHGYSLDDAWAEQWRRMYDRHGRPDPDGPPQQRQNFLRGREYEMDLAASDFPLASEETWRRAETGARLRMQSLDEFSFVHAVQLKTRAAVGDTGHVGLRFDREHGRGHHTDLLRVDFALDRIARTPLYTRLSLYPRGEKEDIDAELVLGARHPLGELRLRVAAFDLFTDASYALAEGRGQILDRHLDMQDPPLAFALEALSTRWNGLRVELYGGLVIPQAIRVRHPERPEDDHHRTHEAWLAAALLEWRPEPLPLTLGLAARRWTSTFATIDHADPARDEVIPEDTTRLDAYALADLPGPIHLEASVRRLTIDGRLDPARALTGGETRWLTSLRAIWMPSPAIGLELGLMRHDRRVYGDPAGRLEGHDHRLLTRCVLPIGDNVWTSFGVGWDLDPEDGRYDGGGLTMILVY